jgi:hypothetical protein
MNVCVIKNITDVPSASVVIFCRMRRNTRLNAEYERNGRNKASAEWFKVLLRNSH